MEARGHAIVLFSAGADRGRWVLVVLLSVGGRAVSLTVLAEEQLTAVPATTRPAEPASPCLASPEVSFLHQGCYVLGRPKAGANSGRPGILSSPRRAQTSSASLVTQHPTQMGLEL